MRNAALAVGLTKQTQYSMRTKPGLWQADSVPDTLHLLLIDLKQGEKHELNHQPLILLSRRPLTAFPIFPIYQNSGHRVEVNTKPVGFIDGLASQTMDRLTTFTLRIFQDLFNKTYEKNPAKMPYWLVPALHSSQCEQAADLIDWAAIETACNEECKSWTPDMPASMLLDKLLIDPYHGGNRAYSLRLATEYDAATAVPAGSAKFQSRHGTSILDSSVSLWRKARQTRTWNMQQPVLEVEMVMLRRNMLATPVEKETKVKTRGFLCPEPLKISTLSTNFARMGYVFPAIIHRLDAYLIAAEACTDLGLDVSLPLALEAVTKDSDNTEDHQSHERINFQSGMGPNYERLEFLGDTFLKMATSIAVFIQNPNDNEFEFHVKRMLMLCNQNLFNVAEQKHIYEYIRSRAFSR